MALADRLIGAGRSLGGVFFGGSDIEPSANNGSSGFGVDDDLTREMHDTIAARITAARATAAAANEDFSIEHYRQECVAFAETPTGQRMVADGKWTPASYANLSGQDLHGIRLTNPKAIKPGHELCTAIQADYDSFDRDGDGTINCPAVNQFYDRVTFDKKTDLRNAIVDPATSFNREIASATNLDGLTFNNMREGDHFEFGAGRFTNIKMTNIQGGEIVFGDASHVDGLSIDGVSAAITIGDRATVSHVTVNDNFRIVNLSMGKGATLSDSDLSTATISMASEFGQGASLQNVQLGSNVAGLDFSGLRLNNVTIDGVPIQRPSDLDRFGISYDERTLASVSASPEMASNHELAQIRAIMQEAVASIGSGSPAPATAQPAQVIPTRMTTDNPENTFTNIAGENEVLAANKANNGNSPLAAARASMIAAGIMGGENFKNLNEVLAGGYNPGKDLVARVQPNQSMGMTMPGSNA